MKKNTQNSRETLKNGEKHSKFMNMHTVHTLDEKALSLNDKKNEKSFVHFIASCDPNVQ